MLATKDEHISGNAGVVQYWFLPESESPTLACNVGLPGAFTPVSYIVPFVPINHLLRVLEHDQPRLPHLEVGNIDLEIGQR